MNYFQKSALLGQKRNKIFGTSIPGQIRNNCSRAFEGLSYLAYKIFKNLCIVICFIHIIQWSHFSNEYLPIADKKVNIHL